MDRFIFPPEWDEIVKACDFAVSTFDEVLKGITNRDNLRALSCKNIIEERWAQWRQKYSTCENIGAEIITHFNIKNRIQNIFHLAESALNL